MLTNKLPQLWIVWTVIVLFFVNLLNYMDRYTIAGILPEIQDPTTSGFPYKVDYMEGGLLQTSFIITFMVLSPLFGYLGDRFKRKYIMAVGIFIWGLFVLAGSFSVNYPMLLATRSLVGVGEASYGTIAPTIIADLFPADKRLRVLSLFYMAIPIGSAMGYGVGSFLSSQIREHFHDPQSWRWSLRVTPSLSVIAIILILFTIKEPHRGQSEDPRSTTSVRGSFSITGYLKELLYLFKNKTFMLTSFGFAAVTFSIGALAMWAPTLLYHTSLLMHALGISPAYTDSEAALGFGIITVIAGLVGTISGSELSKFIGRWTNQSDCLVCAIGLLVGSPFLFLALSIGSLNQYLGWVLIFLAEFFFCLIWAPVGAVLLYVVIPECRATAEAIQILLIHLLGDAASPFIIGAISDVLVGYFRHSSDEIYSNAIGMRYALYITVIISAIGGGLFLMSTLTVGKDRKNVDDHVKSQHTRYPESTTPDDQLLDSEVGTVKVIRDNKSPSGSSSASSDCSPPDEKTPLTSDKSINS